MPQDVPDFDLMGFIPYRLAVAADRLSNGLAAQYRREYGISVAEWRVLVHLLGAGDVSVRDIEKRVHLEKSKISRAASKLQRDGYISKDINDTDRRLVQLALTQKGQDLMARLVPLATAYQAKLESLLSAHLAEFNAALDLLTEDDDDRSTV